MTAQPLPLVREDHPGLRQSLAANPLKSHWVGASAGTGKTKVLIDRVLRLMLPRPGQGFESATPPGRILCLTFTKTGAAEMSNRIYESLSAWSVMDDATLDKKLLDLTGAPATALLRGAARRLFARVLDVPGGLKIMTIHSFCQSVLKRFPLEAGLPPHFSLMDEAEASETLEQGLHGVIAAARARPDSLLARGFETLALYLDARAMTALMSGMMAKRGLLRALLLRHGDEGEEAERSVAALRARLNVPEGETETAVRRGFCAPDAARDQGLRAACDALLRGGKTDQGRGEILRAWLEGALSDRVAGMEDYAGAFLTGDGDIYKTLASQAAEKNLPGIGDLLRTEAERLCAARARIAALKFFEANAALLRVAAAVEGRYAARKRETGRLDYDDLIFRTRELLSDKARVQWVLYKLDEGIDHILVDEAQDTSPHQWAVVEALSEEFFAGEGARDDAVRTLFVVGDEKQSIFSFQGADPGAFARMQALFGGRARQVQEGWEIFLEHSFRSTAAVLGLVDSVFAREDAVRGVVLDAARRVRHLPFRAGQAGLAELWPLIEPAQEDKPGPWRLPLEVEAGNDAAAALARKIAGTVAGWIAAGEILPSKDRPLKAGDVLVLVRTRGPFVEKLMRAFKEAGVPVAGVDRMTLSEEIAVMDLVAAAQCALQPEDDLTLATVLKSPLGGLDDEALFDLCHNRAGPLWDSLRSQKPDVAAFFGGLISDAGRVTPYEFFAGLLARPCPADAVSGRRALQGRLGGGVADALDEFLSACLTYEQSHAASVQGFVDWFLKGETEIKREQAEQGQDQVRIMTVHGAKGLQAPVVFLPDTVSKPGERGGSRARLVWPDEEGDFPLWSPRSDLDVSAFSRLAEAARAAEDEEYRRLLYVALTRAEDRLYVCGWRGRNTPKDDCWHSLTAAAIRERGEPAPFLLDGAAQALPLWRVTCPQEAPPEKEKQAESRSDSAARAPLPAWAFAPAAREAFPPVPLAPSRPGSDEPAAKGPLRADDGWRFRRGVVVHQLLELLPGLPLARRALAAQAFLARPALGIPVADQARFTDEVLAVLDHPGFAPLFGPGSRAEVPVTGPVAGGRLISGQMDRLLVTPSEVLVVDYKTNRPPPKTAAETSPAYLRQMAAYRAVLRQIYPDRAVRCALLWTDVPLLMPLPDALLDPYAP